MRTNIVIDDDLMRKTLAASGARTKRDAVEEAMRFFVQIKGQAEILKLRGKIHWEGDLDAMRSD